MQAKTLKLLVNSSMVHDFHQERDYKVLLLEKEVEKFKRAEESRNKAQMIRMRNEQRVLA